MAETQKSVHEWCKTTFSRFAGLQGRATALLEEAVELALTAGLSSETIYATARVPILKEAARAKSGWPTIQCRKCAAFFWVPDGCACGEHKPFNSMTGKNGDAEEIADVMICVYACAEEAGYDARKELDEKMALNRSRPAEYYAEKTARKEELG